MANPQPTAERWLPVVGWEDLYEVSDHGRVRSMDRDVLDSLGRLRPIRGKILRAGSGKNGHQRVNLWLDGQGETFHVHRLVAAAFIGDPEGLVVRHLNDVPTDNHISNLAIGTLSDNSRDAVRNGVHPSTRKTHCKQGHEYDEENTYRVPGSEKRACKKCTSRWARERYIRNRDVKRTMQSEGAWNE